MFTLRFDLRVPPFAETTHAGQYAACLDICEWADTRGFTSTTLSEHHGTEDGFVASPLTVAAAILARTRTLMCSVAALIVPLHDPIRLAEDIATIDVMAPGRLVVVAGVGYRESEFEMFAADRSKRGRDLEEGIELMLRAWGGEPFEHDGRTIWVTPKPVTEPHPLLMVGGSVEASARRAARLRLPFMPALGDQALADVYYATAREVGYETPFALLPSGPGMVMVSEDPDRTWDIIARNALYDAGVYAGWQRDDQRSSWWVTADDVEGLKASGQWAVVTPDGCVALARRHGNVVLHPLVGGIDPAIGWESLELVHSKVMPQLEG